MKPQPTLQIRQAASVHRDEAAAIAEIHAQLAPHDPQVVLFFCSPRYDLAQLNAALITAFGLGPVVGCTTAGQLGPAGFARSGLTAVSMGGDLLVRTFILDLQDMESAIAPIAAAVREARECQPAWHPFGLLLVDGLSRCEEQLTSLLYRQLPQLPVVGGSAGDDLAFQQTHVYAEGGFHTGKAVFTLIHTPRAFRTFKFQHFQPTETPLVVTASDPKHRMVLEINGRPAVEVYTELVGVPAARLDAEIFSRHPFVLEMGGEHYIRSISNANPDHSLTLYCAIEDGVILSLGRAMDPVAVAETAFQQMRDHIGVPELIIGCDCILRRLEFEHRGLLDTMGGIMKANRVVGFSTYGEQFDGLHVNQTFTGIALGTEYDPH